MVYFRTRSQDGGTGGKETESKGRAGQETHQFHFLVNLCLSFQKPVFVCGGNYQAQKKPKDKNKYLILFCCNSLMLFFWAMLGRLLGSHSRKTVIFMMKKHSAATWYVLSLPFSFFLSGILRHCLEIKQPFCNNKDKGHMERLTESICFLNGWSCTSPALPASSLFDKG